MYIKKEYVLGKDYIEVHKYHSYRYGAPGKKREQKEKVTPEQIKRQNESNRVRKLQRLILANFKEGDWHLILKYKKGEKPDRYEDGVKILSRFLSKIRNIFKKSGLSFKYIGTTERGKKGQALHHHIIVEDIQTDKVNILKLVKKYWNGYCEFVAMYEDGAFKKLAQYLVKTETKEEASWASYTRSRNLIEPKPKTTIMKRKTFSNDPKPKKGYYIEKDSVEVGINPYTGYQYQRYMMKRIPAAGNRTNVRRKTIPKDKTDNEKLSTKL